MRAAILELLALGRLPAETDASVETLQALERALASISSPLDDEEVSALLLMLPADETSCFGLAWTLVHLLESAPG